MPVLWILREVETEQPIELHRAAHVRDGNADGVQVSHGRDANTKMSFEGSRRLRDVTHDSRLEMSKLAAKLNLTQVGRVCLTVSDADRAIDFYVDTLGFDK